MKIAVQEDPTRRIASGEHNRFVAEGVDKHNPTAIVPAQLLKPFPEDLQKRFESHHQDIVDMLVALIGKPFYSDPGFILYCGDCQELMKVLQRSAFKVNLTITSPPYNIGKEYERVQLIDSYVSWCSTWIEQIFDITSENGTLWLNLGFFEVPSKGLCVPIPYLLWDKSRFYLLQEVVWKYGAGVSTTRRLSPRNEKWLYFLKNPTNYIFNLDDVRDPNVKYPNQKKNGIFRCNPLGKNPSDVWEFPKVTTGISRSSKERTGHPAQFPLAVVERLVRLSSRNDDVIFDPFAGSCSTGIAACGLGRIFLGFELDENYCELAVNRFRSFKQARKAQQSQTKLF